jgi:hypothetical protein
MQRILLQFDSDLLPSSFDRVVAIDAGAEQLFSYGGVTPDNVTPLVHGAIFTRGPGDLRHTAIFIGGSDVAAGERLLEAVRRSFFGPLRVSVLCDPNGANTTAAATVRAALRHLDPSQTTALILGGTGPVGQRAARLLAQLGARVRLASRSRARAAEACQRLRDRIPGAMAEPCESSPAACADALQGAHLLIAAGAAGVQFLAESQWRTAASLHVAIDLNAVPPAGLEGIGPADKAVVRDHITCYGAIGVGGLKMKIHRAAVGRLFESNDQILDLEEVYALAGQLS